MTNAHAYAALADRPRLDLSASTRVGWVDGARGLSIAAMIFSHVGLWSGLTPWWFHLYVMRPVAPAFLLLLGMLWRPGWRRRHWQLAAGVPVAAVCAAVLGFALPNILALLLGVIVVLHVASRWPIAALVFCIVQVTFWPMPEWWTGYQPGFALAFAVIGNAVAPDGFLRGYGRLGQLLGLELVGRFPLRFYLGHLLLLSAVTVSVGLGGG